MSYPAPSETSIARLVRSIRALYEGRSNAVGSFTCSQNQATTTVAAPNCGPDSKVLLTPRHANAAAELGNGTLYVSAVVPGQFTVAHSNSGTGNRTFDYAIQG
jgi:hypothetical protein